MTRLKKDLSKIGNAEWLAALDGIIADYTAFISRHHRNRRSTDDEKIQALKFKDQLPLLHLFKRAMT